MKTPVSPPIAKATLRDIALAAGVHISTVSRALHPTTRQLITPEVAERIQEIASRLGYRSNVIAASLRRGRSNMIGVVIPDLLNPVFPPIIVGIEEVLTTAGNVLTIGSDGGEQKLCARVLDNMLARQVDGLILATASLDDPIVEEMLRCGVALVLINRRDGRNRTSTVSTDEKRGMGLIVEHLVGLGHKTIAHVAGPQTFSTGMERLEGFIAAMRDHDLAVAPEHLVIAGAYSRAAGREAAAALLAASPRPTAIAAGNDLLALGCYDALFDAGLRCPQDVSVTGYNDMPLMDMVAPPLTTVRIQHHQIGAEAARLLLRKLDQPGSDALDVVLQPELVIRASTCESHRSTGNPGR